jgi:hypothetical protein
MPNGGARADNMQVPPQWSILKTKDSHSNHSSEPPLAVDSARSGREGYSTTAQPRGLNEPGIMYVSESEQRLDGSMRKYGSASALLDTLAYSMDTLPLPPGTSSATSAGDAFPIAPPLSSGKAAQQQQKQAKPPGVSVLRGLDTDPLDGRCQSQPLSSASGVGSGSLRAGKVVTGGGMKMYRNDLFEQNMEMGGFTDADAGGYSGGPSTASAHMEREPSPRKRETWERDPPGAAVNKKDSERVGNVSSREQLIRERGKQHARNVFEEKHSLPTGADASSQSANTEQKTVDLHDDNITVATGHSGVSYRSAFPPSTGHTEEPPSTMDSRTARRDKKKGDLIEISFADVSKAAGGGGAVGGTRAAAGEVDGNAEAEEEKRRVKFELMRKKKMEEAAEREKVGRRITLAAP